MSNEEKNEVVLRNSYEVSTEFADMFDKGLQSSGDNMDAEDIRLPKLTLIQAMTKQSFNEQNAPVGNYVNSIEKFDMGNELDIFVMSDVKLWQFDYGVPQGKGKEDKKEYLTIVDHEICPNIRDNYKKTGRLELPQEVIEKAEQKGIDVSKIKLPDLIYRFYVLLVDEVKGGMAFPYILDFKRSSAAEGNKLKNIFFKMRKMAKIPSYAKVFTLTSEFVQEEHDYYVKKVTTGRNITKDELLAVETWVRELQKNEAKYSVDESDNDVESNDDNNTVETTVVNNDGDQPKF